MDQLDAEARADRLQRHGAIRRAVIDDELTADATLEHRLFEHALDVEGALGEAERTVGDEARGVIEERDEVGLALPSAGERFGSVQHIAVPDIVRMGGREAAPLLRNAARRRRTGETMQLEQPVNRRAGDRAAGNLAGVLEPLLQGQE